MNYKQALSLAILLAIVGISSAQLTQSMQEKSIELRNGKVRLTYFQTGEGEMTLLFLHGWCLNASYWEKQITHFSQEYNCIALDIPGFGKSSANRENWTIEEFAKDISAFIEKLKLEKVIIIGHSMSGDIMLETALKENSSIMGLVGVDNFKFLDVVFPPEEIEQFQAFFPLLKNDFKTYAPIYAENGLFHPSMSTELKDRIKSDFANTDPAIGYSSFINVMQYSELTPTKLDHLNYKLHLINSDAIPTNEAGLTAHCKQGFEVKNVGPTGHFPMIEKPDTFNELLEEILSSLAK